MQTPVTLERSFGSAAGGKLLSRVHWVSTFLLAVTFLSALIAEFTGADARLPEALLMLAATFSTLVALARQLPLQNVLLAASMTALIGSLAHLLCAKTGIPFGPVLFGSAAGLKLFGMLPWIVPLLWIVAVLNSRSVARLVLRPWRKMRAYGFWLLGLTALFTMLFDWALEPVTTRITHCWIWTAGGFSLTPQAAPVSNAIGWLVVTLLILAFVTPVLINKQLSKRSMPDFHPLAVWLGAIVLCGVISALHGLWVAVVTDAVIGLVTAGLAVRGARW
ncbi:MAG TPA: carotenoid biosynthesis protein [Verrucomicrobiae bacterium]|nr:carotenoid biosynthesis protein [Verrucomicrobiae bacterium]